MLKLSITTLSPGYHDRDELFLHAAFQILVDFVEKEKPDWSATKERRRIEKEINSLYCWWKYRRPKRRDPLEAPGLKKPPFIWKEGKNGKIKLPFDRKKYARYDEALQESVQCDAAWYAEDDAMLQRLVKVRKYLWT